MYSLKLFVRNQKYFYFFDKKVLLKNQQDII